MDKKIITLGGSSETGKTTMYKALERREGERYRFVPDTLSPLLAAYPCAEFEPYVMQAIFKQAIAEHVVNLKSHDGRPVICDTGLIDLASRAQFILETRDFVWLNRHMKEQEHIPQLYVKLPLHVVPTDITEGHQYNQHHRIDRTLRKNDQVEVAKVPATIHAFEARYNKVLWLIERFVASDRST